MLLAIDCVGAANDLESRNLQCRSISRCLQTAVIQVQLNENMAGKHLHRFFFANSFLRSSDRSSSSEWASKVCWVGNCLILIHENHMQMLHLRPNFRYCVPNLIWSWFESSEGLGLLKYVYNVQPHTRSSLLGSVHKPCGLVFGLF